jgi:hypothetical protein
MFLWFSRCSDTQKLKNNKKIIKIAKIIEKTNFLEFYEFFYLKYISK